MWGIMQGSSLERWQKASLFGASQETRGQMGAGSLWGKGLHVIPGRWHADWTRTATQQPCTCRRSSGFSALGFREVASCDGT